MKLWLMSDLHFEFHADGGAAFLASLPDVDHDVAILAGDICSFGMIPGTYERISKRFKKAIVLIGNHEAYGSSIADAANAAFQTAALLPNVRFLERGSVTIEGVRIHGATLWFPYPGPTPGEEQMNDFWQIRGLRNDVDCANRVAVAYLEDYVRPGDVVVTHHLPSAHSVAEQYSASALNAFFVGGAAHVLKGNGAELWVHGHTHSSIDTMVGGTRVVCNPLGYVPHDVNRDFSAEMVIEVQPTKPTP